MTLLSLLAVLSLGIAARLWLYTCDQVVGPETPDETWNSDL